MKSQWEKEREAKKSAGIFIFSNKFFKTLFLLNVFRNQFDVNIFETNNHELVLKSIAQNPHNVGVYNWITIKIRTYVMAHKNSHLVVFIFKWEI